MRLAFPGSRTAEGEARVASVASWLPAAAIATLVCAAAVGFAGSMLHFTRGHFSPPLDDTLIYFQYARQAAHGDFLRFNDGAPRTSGATSFLYPLILAGGHLVGFRQDGLVVFALLLNAALLGTACALAYAVARRLASDDSAGYAAATLIALNGWLGWTFFSMMETGLHTALLLLAIYLYLRATEEARVLPWLAACLALLPFVRPELTVIAVAIAVTWTAQAYAERGRRTAWRDAAPLAAAVAASALYFVAMRLLTGSARTSTFTAQSVISDPSLSGLAIAAKISDAFAANVRFAFTWFGPAYLSAVAFIIFLAGTAMLVAEDVAARRLTHRCLLPALALLGIATASLVKIPDAQFYRWPAPYEALIAIVMAYAIWSAPRYLPSLQPLVWPVAGTLLAGSAISAVDAVSLYGQNSADIYFQQTATALWLRDNTPPDALIGINDAGAIPYYSGRDVHDLVGLVTRGNSQSFRQGWASSFERLERLPQDARPDFYAIYPAWFPFADGKLGFLTPVAKFRLERTTIAGFPEKVIYRPDYTLFNSGDAPGALPLAASGWSVVDSIDVADLASERAHAYGLHQREVGVGLPQVVETHTYEGSSGRVIDGGRTVAGSERFTLRLRDPAKPYIVLMRASTGESQTLIATAGGRSREVALAPSDAWRDVVLAQGQGTAASLGVEVDAAGATYDSFYYWLLQPD